MFRLLGVHAGPDISASAAASLAGLPLSQARELLIELTHGHLIAENVPGRFAFHDLLRAYAAECARAHDSQTERSAAMRRSLDHYLHSGYAAALLLNPPTRHPISLASAAPGTRPEEFPDASRALAWFDAERQVLLGAIAQAAEAAEAGFASHAWQLTWTMAIFFDRRGHWHDWAAVQRTALAASQLQSDFTGQAHAHLALGYVRCRLGSYEESNADLHQSLDLFRRLGDHLYQAHVHTTLSTSLERQNRLSEALDHGQCALDLYRAADHPGQATALNTLGWQHALLGQHQQALSYCQQALDLHTTLGNRQGEASTWDSLGYAHHHLGSHARAITCYMRALALCRELGDRGNSAAVLTHLGDVHRTTGDLNAASSAWQEALTILDDLHDPDARKVRVKLAELPDRPDRSAAESPR
jgi:tetratricopeptide (TPR) repeat protein